MFLFVASRFGVDTRSPVVFSKDVMDMPELQRGVRTREAQLHDERLQNAEAQVVAGRGVGWFEGLLRVLLLAKICWPRDVLQIWCSEESGEVTLSQEERQKAAGIS